MLERQAGDRAALYMESIEEQKGRFICAGVQVLDDHHALLTLIRIAHIDGFTGQVFPRSRLEDIGHASLAP